MRPRPGSLQRWLQERQYATPYHWNQRINDELEYQLRTRIVLELAELTSAPRARLLDVGCGDARFLADAAAHADAVGIDVSTRAIGHAHRLVPTARVVTGGAEALPFRDSTFDVVTLLDVIEHISDRDEPRVIAEAHRVLEAGGRLVISTNTDQSAREWKHFRHYPVPCFRRLFDRFSEVTMVGLIPYFPTLRFWMALPVASRIVRHRITTCAPERAQTVIGVGVKR